MGLPSLKWLLELGAPIPEVGRPAQLPDGRAQRRIAALFVKALEGNVDSRIRAQALSMAGDVNIRRHALSGPALAKAVPAYFEPEPSEAAALSAEWRPNWEYVRDHVAPEMTRPNRDDQQACLGCHGVPGRVPSLELANADNRGYVKAPDLFANYRKLVERVNEANVE